MAGKDTTHEDKIKHLDYIQNAINTRNNNAFQMKGWMLGILTALLAAFASTGNKKFVLLAILPTLIFWLLDTYYLQLERKFRGLYNDVAGITAVHTAEIKPFAMPLNLYKGEKYSFWDVFGSVTILPLYLPVIVILVGIYVFL